MLSPTEQVAAAEDLIARALKDVHEANEDYIEACKLLAKAKLNLARSTPHPWYGQSVYRIMGGAGLRHRVEHGVVSFKEYDTPDCGNSHIAPGTYYVLVDGKSAHWLNNDWELDLL